MRYFIFIILLTLFAFGDKAVAQIGGNKPNQKQAKFITKTYIGKFTGNPIKLSVEEAKAALNAHLQIIDNTNTPQLLSSYQLAYNRIGVTEDEVTGKLSPTTDLVSDRFYKTPLPNTWRGIISETIKKGEEILFFDVIGIDKFGKKFLAPDIKIIVE